MENQTLDPFRKFPHLSFDGCGINDRDEYRTRIATFTEVRGAKAKEFGPLFAAAPDLLAQLEAMTQFADSMNKRLTSLIGRSDWAEKTIAEARATIVRAKSQSL